MVDRPVMRVGVIVALAFAGAGAVESGRTAQAAARSGARSDADRDCLARAMYFESEKSSEDGMLAVGTVVANRVKSGRYGSSFCGVVGERGQFAAGVMSRRMEGGAAERARRVAEAVLAGHRHPSVKNAMFFHTAGYRFGYGDMHYLTVAGGNIFYEKRSAKTPAAARANALSRARAYAVAEADKAAVVPALTAALRGRKPPAAASDASVVLAQIVPLPATAEAPIPSPRPARNRFGPAPLQANAFQIVSAYSSTEQETPANAALAAIAALSPKQRPAKPVRTISPATPVQAAMTPVGVVAAAPKPSPMANRLVFQAWAAFN